MTHALLLALALSAPAEATISNGKTLFNSIDLGVNGKACALCHAGGKAFDAEELANRTSKEVGILVNHCLSLRMKSPKLAPESVELQSLVLYVKTFQQKAR